MKIFFFWGRRMVNKLLDVVGYIWAFRNWRWSEQDQSPTSFLPMFVSFWSQAKEWCKWIRNVVRGEREDQGGWHRKEAEAHDNDGNARTERGRKALWLWGQEAWKAAAQQRCLPGRQSLDLYRVALGITDLKKWSMDKPTLIFSFWWAWGLNSEPCAF